MPGAPFEYLHHLVTVPVTAGGHDTRFILDSGIGLTLVTDRFAERLGLEPGPETFTGRRMSGQAVTLPLATLPALTFDTLHREVLPIGILDTSGFPPEVADLDGFLSLAFFAESPFTVDYPRGVVYIGAPGGGASIDIRVESDGPDATAFMPLVLPNGRTVEVEIDMGSDVLILDESLAADVGVGARRSASPGRRRARRDRSRLHAQVRLDPRPHPSGRCAGARPGRSRRDVPGHSLRGPHRRRVPAAPCRDLRFGCSTGRALLMDVSVVVTVLNEEGAVEELYRRIASSLDGRDWEVIFIDDGSTDATFARLRTLHEGDARMRVVRFKRNFGQHPAMHAGLVRARGDLIVTMDGDLQNEPEDIPKLLAALDRADVASGRRIARHDSPGRTLPSRVINGLLRRFTGVHIADFGCAFNGYRRGAIEPMLGAIGRQKFTKALVVSTGVSVEEVDVSHAASSSGSRYSPLRLVRLALHVVAGFWPQPVQWIGVSLGLVCSLAAAALGVYGVVYWIVNANFPGPLFAGAGIVLVLGIQGFVLALIGESLGRIQRDVEGRPLYTIEEEL